MLTSVQKNWGSLAEGFTIINKILKKFRRRRIVFEKFSKSFSQTSKTILTLNYTKISIFKRP